MRRPLPRFSALLALALLASTAGVPAAGEPSSGLPAATYRLEAGSGFGEGCIDPCDCPIGFSDDLRGTFRLVPEAVSTLGGRFSIEEINWMVTRPTGGEARATGSGTLRRGGGLLSVTLEISLDGAEPRTYESGPVPAAGFPSLSFVVRIPGAMCVTDGFRVRASPLAAADVLDYRMTGAGGYAVGCLASGCLCPITFRPMSGTFGLVPLGAFDDVEEFAVVDVSWRLAPVTGGPSVGDPVTGTGFYRVDGSRHEMFGEFAVAEEPAVPFSSGLVEGAGLPFIGISMLDEATGCVNQQLTVDAQPVDPSLPRATPR